MSQAPATSRLQELKNWRPTREQLLRFAISLLLSVLLWGWVTQVQDPFRERNLAGITIQEGSLPDNLQIVTSLPDARVTVSGSRSDVEAVRQSEIVVTTDTSGISNAGTFQVPLTVSGVDVSEVSVEPREVTIQIDERETVVLPLRVDKTEAAGDQVTTSDVQPRVSQVTVTGPRSAVDRVHEVILPIAIDESNVSYDTSIVPIAVDATGLPITEVQILPETVLVHVEVQRQGRSVSVIPNVTGSPADGYAVQQRRALPDTIVVNGPEELLADLLFVNTDPVDISGVTESISTVVGISDLPEGVTIIEPANGQVEVRVAIEDSTTTSQSIPNLPVAVLGLAEGQSAVVEPQAISIDVSAPSEVLQQMTPADVTVLVDVSGLEPGIHVLTPEVSLPPGATWRTTTMDDSRIRVVISESGDVGTPVIIPPPQATPPRNDD